MEKTQNAKTPITKNVTVFNSGVDKVFECVVCKDYFGEEQQLVSHVEQQHRRLMPQAKAVKHDTSKPELDMVPLAAMEGIARALTYGKGKYGKNNYKGGMEWSRVAAALSRHLYKWLDKQEADDESGLNHLDHVAACVSMLLYYQKNGLGKDDR